MESITESKLTFKKSLGELTETGWQLLKRGGNSDSLFFLVEKALEATRSDLGAYYIRGESKKSPADLKLYYQNFHTPLESSIPGHSDLSRFIHDCRETIIHNTPGAMSSGTFLTQVLLHNSMKSGAAVPLVINLDINGILFVNSKQKNHYNKNRFIFLENLVKLSAGIIGSHGSDEGEKK